MTQEKQNEIISLIFQDYNVKFKDIKVASVKNKVYSYSIKDELGQEMNLEVNFSKSYYKVTTKEFEEIIELVTL